MKIFKARCSTTAYPIYVVAMDIFEATKMLAEHAPVRSPFSQTNEPHNVTEITDITDYGATILLPLVVESTKV